jgi:hypothetical protein
VTGIKLGQNVPRYPFMPVPGCTTGDRDSQDFIIIIILTPKALKGMRSLYASLLYSKNL